MQREYRRFVSMFQTYKPQQAYNTRFAISMSEEEKKAETAFEEESEDEGEDETEDDDAGADEDDGDDA